MRNMLPRANWLRAITYARLVMKMEECGRWILPIAAFQYPLKDCMNLMGFAALTPNNPIRTPLPPCVANDSPLPMRPTSFLSILVLTIFILQQGCVSTEPPRLKTSQLSEEERTSIRTVGIAVSEQLPPMTLELPSKGALRGAGLRAGKWTGGFLQGIANSGDAMQITIWFLPLAPVVAVAGAFSGAIEASSAATVETMEMQVRRVLQDERLIGEFGKQVHDHITNRTVVVPTLLPKAGIDDADGGDTKTRAQPDARLTIVLTSVGLQGASDVNPPLTLHLETKVTVIYQKPYTRSEHVGTSYSRTIRYESKARTLAEWTADGGSLLRKSVEVSLAQMAARIVGDVFLGHPADPLVPPEEGYLIFEID